MTRRQPRTIVATLCCLLAVATSAHAECASHDAAKLDDVLVDEYRAEIPDPRDITRFEWETILRFMGADTEEIKDVQVRMGRVWR